jgi:pilus assembly protein CpaE
MFSYVILDTPHMFDPKTLEAFELSDHIIVVTVPNISSLRATKKALTTFKGMGYGPDKVKVVVNRAGKGDPLKPDEIAKTLHNPVSWVIPNEYKVAVDALNSGIPLVQNHARSKVGKSILGLADDIIKWRRSAFILEMDEEN